MIWATINHTMPALPTVEADAPMFDHGEMADKPNPAPNASRISDKAAATNAPAITAAQDTPDEYASSDAEFSIGTFPPSDRESGWA